MSATDTIRVRPASTAGYVLAGGASQRFGSDKALANFGGETLLAKMCKCVEAAAGNVSIVAPGARYADLPHEIIEDRWPGEGPLGGIVTALQTTQSLSPTCEWNLILSCDMPFLTVDWLRFLIDHAYAGNCEVIAPRSEHGWEPLCACWRTSSLATLRAAFDRGTRKVTDAMKLLPVEILDETHWKRFDIGGRLFWNMNTPRDYEDAARILKSGRA
jgi:molybdopterin-guanine dinucleotide biosynthesis protein A